MLVGIILMQSSKSGGMGAAMTGNALNTAFGGQGADKLLVRITAFLATLFLILVPVAMPSSWYGQRLTITF